MYYNNYYRKERKYSPQEIKRRDEEIEERNINSSILKLKENFGNDFKEPEPERFDLTPYLVNEVRNYNKKIREYNTRNEENITKIIIGAVIISYGVGAFFIAFSGLVKFDDLGDIGTLLLMSLVILFVTAGLVSNILRWILMKFFVDKEYHRRTEIYDRYVELVDSHPGKEKIEQLVKRKIFFEKRRKQKDYWFSLGGHEFEEQMVKILSKYDYKDVLKTKGSGDGGVDIIVTKQNDEKVFVQCKAHKKPVGPEAVRALFGVMTKYKINEGVVVNLGGFSIGAIDFVSDQNIRLLDIDDVIRMSGGN